MLSVGLTLVVLGAALVLGGRYVRWMFRDGQSEPRDTITGGYWLGALWVGRIGRALLALGLMVLFLDVVLG